MNLWHYTTRSVMPKILEVGALLPKSYQGEDQATPTLWFSSNDRYEHTALKRIGIATENKVELMSRRLTFEEQDEVLGHVRIKAPDDMKTLSFLLWVRAVGKHPGWAASLAAGGAELGAHWSQWYASFDPLPCERWAAVEIYDLKTQEWRSV